MRQRATHRRSSLGAANSLKRRTLKAVVTSSVKPNRPFCLLISKTTLNRGLAAPTSTSTSVRTVNAWCGLNQAAVTAERCLATLAWAPRTSSVRSNWVMILGRPNVLQRCTPMTIARVWVLVWAHSALASTTTTMKAGLVKTTTTSCTIGLLIYGSAAVQTRNSSRSCCLHKAAFDG